MQVTKRSMLTDKIHTLDIPNLNYEDYEHYINSGELIQIALPHLNDDEREFLISGVTKEEWDTYIPEEE